MALSSSLVADVRLIMNIVLPTAIGNAMEYLPVCVGMSLVGHGGDGHAALELDALALARAYFNMVAYSPGFGIISALRTLCPQAVGADRPQLCALYLQRAFFFIVLGFGFVFPMLYFSDRILLWTGQPPELCGMARLYVLRMIPQYFGCVGMSAIQRIFQAHNWNYANLAIVAIIFAASPGIQWLLIKTLGFGWLGAAWSGGVINALYPLLQVPYLVRRGHGYLFKPQLKSLSCSGLGEYVRLMLPGFLMTCMEWWVLEAVVLLSGRLHHAKTTVGAFTISSQVQSLALMAWIGLAVAASSLVGQRIGAGDMQGARRAAKVTTIAGLCLSALVGAAVATLAAPIAATFTTSKDIQALTTKLLPFVAGVMVVDATCNALGGVCSGLGQQRISAAGSLTGYYLVGLPVAVGCAFYLHHGEEQGVYWLWAGVACAMLTALLVQLVALLRPASWARASREAAERLERRAVTDDSSPSRARRLASALLPADEPRSNASVVRPINYSDR